MAAPLSHVPRTGRRPAVAILLALGAGLAAAAGVATSRAAHGQEPATATLPSIFNGRDLDGWKTPDHPYWKVVDGVLVGANDGEKLGSMLYTEKSFGDVILEGEVRWTGEIDSGFMFRKPEVQLQIGVSRSLKRDMTCSFYVGGYPEEAQAKRAGDLLKAGDWNRIRVRVKGNVFTVWLNGEEVSRYTAPAPSEPAPIGLQIHGGLLMKVEFRDLRALPLD